jgi:bifunctional DNA-binding transcriptional regulator/antitoxin component of YhaV-PrlF toxin-antitoxin module
MSTVTMDKMGRVVIPLDLRQKAELLPGEELIVVAEGEGEFRVMTRAAARRKAQELAQKWLKPGQSLADELIAERRRESELENQG